MFENKSFCLIKSASWLLINCQFLHQITFCLLANPKENME